MNKWIIAGILLAAGLVRAEQVERPDANTLWMENGKEIKLGKKPNFRHWFKLDGKKELEIKPLESGQGREHHQVQGSGPGPAGNPERRIRKHDEEVHGMTEVNAWPRLS